MNKAKVLGFIGGVAGAALYSYVWYNVGLEHATKLQPTLHAPRAGNLSVLIKVRAANDWNFVYGCELPPNSSITLPTDIGTFTFLHNQ